nr:tmv resistance protein n [Quercus suber]
MSDSQNLIEIPDLSGVPNLKQLILRRCTRLYMIRASLGDLKQLIQLDLNGFKGLKSLPHKINLEALEIIDLGGCSRLKKFPEITGNMSHLLELCLSETVIKDLSLLLEHLTSLTKLDLRECKNLSSLPNAICSLMSLKTLNLSGCSRLDKLPENLGNVEGLEIDANGFSQIDVQIETEGPGLEVTKCGARLAYKQDIEDLKQTTAGSSRCSIIPYEDDLDDSAKDTKIKCSCDDFDGDKAGPSGEATNSEVDIPHSKRIRLPNLIERFIPHLGNWVGNSSTQEEGDSDYEEEKSQ